MRILLVEDDRKIADFIISGLGEAGHVIDWAADGEDGLQKLRHSVYDASVVDIMLPKLDGLAMVQTIRAEKISTPVIFLSAKREVDDRVRGLQMGGDDYLCKPFSLSELIARLQAIWRRILQIAEPTLLTCGEIQMNLRRHQVTLAGKPVELQLREYQLLEYFLRHVGQIVTKTMIMENVWNYHFDPGTNVVEVCVCRLREKLDPEHTGNLIRTVRGVGYVLESIL